MFDIKNKVVIITGSNSGMGYSLSKFFVNSGAQVVRIDKKFKNKIGNKKIFKNTNVSHDLNYDLSITKNIHLLIKQIVKKFNRIDGLINCHGISREIKRSTSKIKNFDETLNINLRSTYVISSEVCKIMGKRKVGSIINITSLGASLGFPNNPAYQISKAGIKQLSKSLAVDWGGKNIRVNNICPGYIKTNMTIKSYNNSKLKKKRLSRMILKRWGSPNDIIGAACFLISDSSSYITGSDLYIDGGWTAKGL